MKFLVIVCLIAGAVICENPVCAQTTTPTNPADKGFPTTLEPVNPVKYYGPRKAKKQKSSITHNAKNEYYDRIESIWRVREKREKSLERGEATDYLKPPYFGHKKPPKIRPLGKRKYCKICGIRH